LARYGGEEFAVLLSFSDPAGALEMAQRMCRAVQELRIPHARSATSPWVTISVGLAWLQPQQIDVEQTRMLAAMQDSEAQAAILQALVKQADLALYQAKRQGRDRAVLCDEIGEAAVA